MFKWLQNKNDIFYKNCEISYDESNLALGTLIELIDSYIEPLENGMVRYINDKE
jgi:hypothetical protein